MSTTDLTALAARIEELYDRPTADLDDGAAQTVEQVMTMLDEGEIRVAAPTDAGWQVNEWAKKAILLSFRTRRMETTEVGPFEYHDKMPLKRGWAERLRRSRSVRLTDSGRRALNRDFGAAVF